MTDLKHLLQHWDYVWSTGVAIQQLSWFPKKSKQFHQGHITNDIAALTSQEETFRKIINRA